MRSDQHIHTRFSADSETPIHRQVDACMANHFDYICFTDHIDYEFPDEEVDLVFDFDTEEYFRRMNAVRKIYAGQIEIGIGVEMGIQNKASVLEKITRTIKKNPFDLCIASMHVVKDRDPYLKSVWDLYEKEDVFRSFFEDTLACVQKLDCFDVLGHLDYVCRYEKEPKTYSYDKYREVIDEILRTLVEKEKGLECNFSRLARGMGNTNPCPEIIRSYLRMGGRYITIGSDAHVPEGIGGPAYDRAVAMLAGECGVKNIAVYHGHEPELIPIGAIKSFS